MLTCSLIQFLHNLSLDCAFLDMDGFPTERQSVFCMVIVSNMQGVYRALQCFVEVKKIAGGYGDSDIGSCRVDRGRV